jgi:S1-C subfamily serine protease
MSTNPPPPGGSNPPPAGRASPPAPEGWAPPPGEATPPPAHPAPPAYPVPPPASPNPPPSGGYASPPPGGYQPPPGGTAPPPPGGYQPPAGGYPPPPSWTQPPPGGWGAQPSTPPPPPRGRRGWAVFAALLAVLLIVLGGIGAGVGVAVARNLAASHAAAQHPIPTVPQANGSTNQNGQAGGGLDEQAIARKVDPAVVDINTVIQTTRGRPAEAAGTGIILTSNGQVLTNNHVVQGSSSIKVTVQGRSNTYTATVVGVDPTEDVALIQIQGVSGLPTATVADSSTVRVGEGVVAIGNALGQGGTPSATEGTVTALDQSITASTGADTSEQLNGLIQSDAPISPGESGGPLVNAAGQVIGMITAGESQGYRQTTATVGYAIPTNTAIAVVNQIRSGQATGDVIIGQPGFLGISTRSLTPGAAAQLGLDVSSGVLVTGVVSGSPADKAGITQDSVITAIDGKAVDTQKALSSAIQSHKPGQQIRVTWVDQAGTHTATATLTAGANA